ncbi:hypothetical protein CXB51_035385 [Gossypium anomalum]|uniref:Ribulose bisphosphate carboxylase large chain n=1 Tax=Gossypium anomalum TaxID=47600 RepID=A0A8J5Y151_9ROSI|nr:hypothetical protein CXB51_035385 [Gossypium anomalum]
MAKLVDATNLIGLSLGMEHGLGCAIRMKEYRIMMEGLMSPQTETKASVRFKAGVKEYKLTYYTPEYEIKDTDILAAFRVTPQSGVPPEEV